MGQKKVSFLVRFISDARVILGGKTVMFREMLLVQDV